MENSYQFLMMAATIILGVMLLSVFVYVFSAGARASKSVDESQMQKQLIAENTKFEFYNRSNNTVFDMISLINMVYNYNKEHNFAESDSINLIIYLQEAGKQEYLTVDSTLEKNQVVLSTLTDPISIYDFADSNKEILGMGTILEENDTFSKTYYDSKNNKTIYKYLFKEEDFKYNIQSGKVSEMIFRAYITEEWENGLETGLIK